jgi:phosphoribosylformylglycinamidine synthase
MDAKLPGHLVYVVGETRDELGSSEYYDLFNYTGKNVPEVNVKETMPAYKAVSNAIKQELLASVHTICRGGLGVHLAQVAFGGELGLEVDLNKVPVAGINRADKLLFSESAGRFIITLAPENQARFEELMESNNCKFACVGKVTETKNLVIYGLGLDNNGQQNNKIIDLPISELKSAWKGTFGGLV